MIKNKNTMKSPLVLLLVFLYAFIEKSKNDFNLSTRSYQKIGTHIAIESSVLVEKLFREK